jgi:hypothetical protein
VVEGGQIFVAQVNATGRVITRLPVMPPATEAAIRGFA